MGGSYRKDKEVNTCVPRLRYVSVTTQVRNSIVNVCLSSHFSLKANLNIVKFIFPATSDTEAISTENIMHISYA